MRTHFISLIGLDYDMDLLPYWVDYYLDYKFDVYKVWLHKKGDTPENPHPQRFEVQAALQQYHFSVEQAYGEFRNGSLRVKCLEPYHKSLHRDDYVICADSDEFHQLSPRDYFELFDAGFDVISGHLEERYDSTLHDPYPVRMGGMVRIPLDMQYPCRGQLHELILQEHPHVPASRSKILAAKAWVDVSYIGSHRAEADGGTQAAGYLVDHYTCRESLLHRMSGKSYYSPQEILNVAHFFGITDPQDERIAWLYDKLEERFRKQGWVPGANGARFLAKG